MSNTPPEHGGEDWWKANDGKWYPPHRHPDYKPPTPAPKPDPAPKPPTDGERHQAPDGRFHSGPASEPAPSPPQSKQRRQLHALRLLVFVMLAVGALFVVANEPDANAADVLLARISADANEESASGAPQQQVVNGWEAADLLEVVALRSADNRVPLLLTILVLAVCWHCLTASWGPSTAAKSE